MLMKQDQHQLLQNAQDRAKSMGGMLGGGEQQLTLTSSSLLAIKDKLYILTM